MAKLPTFITKAVDLDGNTVCEIDMGAVLLNIDTCRANRVLEKFAKGKTETGYLPIHVGLPRSYFDNFMGNGNQKGIAEPFASAEAIKFVENIGGVAGFRQFSELHRHLKSLQRKKDRIFAEMIDLNGADFVLAPESKNELLYDNASEKYGDVETLIMQYPEPNEIREISDIANRFAAMKSWVRKNGCPYAWDTHRHEWIGISKDDVLSCWDNVFLNDDDDPKDRDFLNELINEVRSYIETQADDEHHEDAVSELVGMSEIDGIVTTWFDLKDDLGKDESGVDKLSTANTYLAGKLKEWNEKQTIVSYFRDSSTIVGLHPDVTKKECVAYQEKQFSDVRAEIEKIENSWLPTETRSIEEVAKPFEKMGIWLQKCPYSSKYKVRSTPADLEETFPTLELAHQFAQELVR